jgi:hypothetical protein
MSIDIPENKQQAKVFGLCIMEYIFHFANSIPVFTGALKKKQSLCKAGKLCKLIRMF